MAIRLVQRVLRELLSIGADLAQVRQARLAREKDAKVVVYCASLT